MLCWARKKSFQSKLFISDSQSRHSNWVYFCRLYSWVSLPREWFWQKPHTAGSETEWRISIPTLLNITTTRSLCHRAPPDGRHSRSRTVHLYSQVRQGWIFFEDILKNVFMIILPSMVQACNEFTCYTLPKSNFGVVNHCGSPVLVVTGSF